jgi:hypothetical protein
VIKPPSSAPLGESRRLYGIFCPHQPPQSDLPAAMPFGSTQAKTERDLRSPQRCRFVQTFTRRPAPGFPHFVERQNPASELLCMISHCRK